MQIWTISASGPFNAVIRVPGDKSISHRAVIVAAVAADSSFIRGFTPGEDCKRTINALRMLGIGVEEIGPTVLLVHGRCGRLTPPNAEIDCGNSGTTMRLLAGLLAAQPFPSRLVGDKSLSRRPMSRVIDPLRKMGAIIEAESDGDHPPLQIQGTELRAVEYAIPVASAQVKSALLLAALFAKGRSTIVERNQTRDHTERMLRHHGIAVQRDDLRVSLLGHQSAEPRDFVVPGDLSSAAYFIVAAATQMNSRLTVHGVGLNHTRTGVLRVLTRMGAQVTQVLKRWHGCEPVGDIEVEGARLRATEIRGSEIPNLIDELPILAVAAALAEGSTIIADAAELRVKECDRISAIATNLKAMGVEVLEYPDGLEIRGGRPLRAQTLSSFGDHRIAMAFAVAGLFADGETTIVDTDCVATSYPEFYRTLQRLTQSRSQRGWPELRNIDAVSCA